MTPSNAPSVPKQQRSVARREAIINAALALIREQGVHAATHRAVAIRAGVPLAATTYYFAKRDDLLAAAIEVDMNIWIDRLRSPLQENADLKARARHCVDIVLPKPPHGIEDNVSVRLSYEMLTSVGRWPIVADVIANTRGEVDSALVKVLPEGSPIQPGLLLAVIDGAVVSGLAENREIRDYAVQQALALLQTVHPELA
ncbi:TetR family transcriptional regulator [Micrococcales bacterium 31B]|nr:TetR family transcriptional regulator [Micrococcales bacterium 31B]